VDLGLAAAPVLTSASIAAMLPIFSIGHSSQPLDAFIALLQRHAVQVIADVRSRPGSRRFTHFSRERLLQGAQVQQAYERRGDRIAYRRDSERSHESPHD
jgi:hypothetical protein